MEKLEEKELTEAQLGEVFEQFAKNEGLILSEQTKENEISVPKDVEEVIKEDSKEDSEPPKEEVKEDPKEEAEEPAEKDEKEEQEKAEKKSRLKEDGLKLGQKRQEFHREKEQFEAERKQWLDEKNRFEQEKSTIDTKSKIYNEELEELRKFKREVEHSVENGGRYLKLDPEPFRAQAKKLQEEGERALAEDDSEKAKQLFSQAKESYRNAESIESQIKQFVEHDQRSYNEKARLKNENRQALFKQYPNLLENEGKNPFYQRTDSLLRGEPISINGVPIDDKATRHLAAYLSRPDNPYGEQIAARAADLILFKEKAQGEIEKSNKKIKELEKEREDLIARLNSGASQSVKGGGTKESHQDDEALVKAGLSELLGI